LHRTTGLIEDLIVYPERMMENLTATRGLVFSGELLLVLAERGLTREHAYEIVQRHAMRVWEEGLDFKQLVLADKGVTSVIGREELEGVFDLDRTLRNVAKIFQRVFGDG
jgi:adenylosuccinate lyase